MTDLRVRGLGGEDAPAFLELVDAHADFEGLARPSPEARERLLRDGLATPPRFRAYLATMEGRDVGYAITFQAYSSFLARPTLFLEDIFVLEAYRGRGFGDAMFRHLVGEAVLQGAGRMEWMVQEWNEAAIRFYERRGAAPLSEWRSFRIPRERLLALAREYGFGEGAGGARPPGESHPHPSPPSHRGHRG